MLVSSAPRKLDPWNVSASENTAELGVMPSAASVVHLQRETGKPECGGCCRNGPCLNPVIFALEATTQGKGFQLLLNYRLSNKLWVICKAVEGFQFQSVLVQELYVSPAL